MWNRKKINEDHEGDWRNCAYREDLNSLLLKQRKNIEDRSSLDVHYYRTSQSSACCIVVSLYWAAERREAKKSCCASYYIASISYTKKSRRCSDERVQATDRENRGERIEDTCRTRKHVNDYELDTSQVKRKWPRRTLRYQRTMLLKRVSIFQRSRPPLKRSSSATTGKFCTQRKVSVLVCGSLFKSGPNSLVWMPTANQCGSTKWSRRRSQKRATEVELNSEHWNQGFDFFAEDLSALHAGRTAEEKFVDHVKELGSDTKDVLLQTAVGVQHALESAGDYIRTQLASTSTEHGEKSTGKENNDLLHQAAILKDAIVQKAIDVKDATVDALKELSAPTDEQSKNIHYSHGTTVIVTEKQPEPMKKVD